MKGFIFKKLKRSTLYVVYFYVELDSVKSFRGFPGGTEVKNPPAKEEDIKDVSLMPETGRSPGGGNGNSLQYSCLGNTTHGQKSLAGYSSRRHKESDMTERTNTYIQQSFKLYLIQ